MSWENNHKNTEEQYGQNHSSCVNYCSEMTPAVMEEESENRNSSSL